MINSLSAAAPAPALTSASSGPAAPKSPPEAEASSASSAPVAPAPPAPKAEPVSLSVDRDTSGVFVYTLTDTASGKVLAVIPRSAMVTSGSGGLDMQA